MYMHLSREELKEFEDLPPVEDEVKKIRQKWVGVEMALYECKKVYRTPSTQGIQRNSGGCRAPQRSVEDIPLV